MKLSSSYQRELNKFCKELISGDFNIREVSASALSQARAKLNPWAFTRLNEVAVDSFYAEADYTKWNNFRLLAVDGTTLALPYSKSVVREFGVEDYIRKQGAVKSMGRASLLYDVCNQVTLDAQLDSYKTSEKELFKRHLEKITKNDLVLGDRSYGTIAIMHLINQQKAKFCIRLRTDVRVEVKGFVASELETDVVEFSTTPGKYEKMGLAADTCPIQVRLVRVVLDTGEIEVLATNLFDEVQFPNSIFKKLYFMRWGVEEAYKILKVRAMLESFTGKTADAIRQDFHAKVFIMTLCATLAHPIAEKVRKEYSASKTGNKYDQQINRTDALSQTKDSLFHLFMNSSFKRILKVFDSIVQSSRSCIRPNRKPRRIKKVKQRKPTNFKILSP